MKPLSQLNQFRDRVMEFRYTGAYVTPEEEDFGGIFRVPSRIGIGKILIMASRYNPEIDREDNYEWNHVSASLQTRCPTWEEMCRIKKLFFFPEETVMQLHPPESQYVNCHPYCLHLWEPVKLTIPLPPSIMVGLK